MGTPFGGQMLPAGLQARLAAPAPAAPTTDIGSYIRQAASLRGIDPDVAIRVALSEGGLDDPVRQSNVITKTGEREQSFGPFQLYLGGGLGNAALARGIDPRKVEHWQAGVDFALDTAKQGGWGPWHGAARVGIGPREGLDGPAAPAVAPTTASGAFGGQMLPEGLRQRLARPASEGEQQMATVPTQDPAKAEAPANVLARARKELGKPYAGPIVGQPDSARWGSVGWDCSSFVSGVLGEFGAKLTPFTDAAYGQTQAVRGEPQPGDVVFFQYDDTSQPGVKYPHMALYAGNGTIIDASYGRGVTERPLPQGLGRVEFRRAPGVAQAERAGVVAQAAQQTGRVGAPFGGQTPPARLVEALRAREETTA